jgi:hypothetical protein
VATRLYCLPLLLEFLTFYARTGEPPHIRAQPSWLCEDYLPTTLRPTSGPSSHVVSSRSIPSYFIARSITMLAASLCFQRVGWNTNYRQHCIRLATGYSHLKSPTLRQSLRLSSAPKPLTTSNRFRHLVLYTNCGLLDSPTVCLVSKRRFYERRLASAYTGHQLLHLQLWSALNPQWNQSHDSAPPRSHRRTQRNSVTCITSRTVHHCHTKLNFVRVTAERRPCHEIVAS